MYVILPGCVRGRLSLTNVAEFAATSFGALVLILPDGCILPLMSRSDNLPGLEDIESLSVARTHSLALI